MKNMKIPITRVLSVKQFIVNIYIINDCSNVDEQWYKGEALKFIMFRLLCRKCLVIFQKLNFGKIIFFFYTRLVQSKLVIDNIVQK